MSDLVVKGNAFRNSGELDKALDMYLEASDQGCALASRILGSMYRLGMGVPNDYNVAAFYYLKAQSQSQEGHIDWKISVFLEAKCEFMLGNFEVALTSLEYLSDEFNFCAANYVLGMERLSGLHRKQDTDKAFNYFSRAAEHHHNK